MTNSTGNVTDTYTYDAWGNVTSHIGSTSQPYQFVGRLGYYTHYQEASFGLMQLGVRFYDSEVGRFTQRDELIDELHGRYSYCKSRTTRLADPDGRQEITYPKLVGSESCRNFLGAELFIREAQKYVEAIVDTLLLMRCPPTITVYCYRKDRCWFFWENRECGKSVPNSGSGAHMHINWAPQCSSPKCLILHEMVHTCGVTGHNWHGKVTIPGCGVGFGRVGVR
jgi:RHS repeat-associated protein